LTPKIEIPSKYLAAIVLLALSACTSQTRRDATLKRAFSDMYIEQVKHASGKLGPERDGEIETLAAKALKKHGYAGYDHYHAVFLRKHGADALFKFMSEVIFIAFDMTSDDEDLFRRKVSGIDIETLESKPLPDYLLRLARCYHSDEKSMREMHAKAIEYYEKLLANPSQY
jgi:hypothetical protein